VTKPGCRNGAATWAAKGLPARLDVAATAKLLGFAEHDIQILMAVGKLMFRGNPTPNAPKWFGADQDWIHKVTKEISKHWRYNHERRVNPLYAKVALGPAPASNQTVFSGRSE
jgi:hypothetical protein